jgi:hypothetical protein
MLSPFLEIEGILVRFIFVAKMQNLSKNLRKLLLKFDSIIDIKCSGVVRIVIKIPCNKNNFLRTASWACPKAVYF